MHENEIIYKEVPSIFLPTRIYPFIIHTILQEQYIKLWEHLENVFPQE